MVQTQIAFAVVGHHARREMAERLAETLGAHLLIDEGDHGANWNHRRANEWAVEQSKRVVILEDDAIPVAGFKELAADWCAKHSDDLLSFYLGTGRPRHWQSIIKKKLAAEKPFITLPTLIHGVCYSIPPQHISRIIEKWPRHLAADYAVGSAWGRDVIYPCQSLVDHADGVSVERHPDGEPRTERRRAWKMADMTRAL
ncbi:hypothetical protein [Sodalis sp. RH22]|uniref:hypothetical protein n=1 Tax=unclassified Sodalis (in: enterobacteria) TaxID=2636512 RepID=UPI0039B39265